MVEGAVKGNAMIYLALWKENHESNYDVIGAATTMTLAKGILQSYSGEKELIWKDDLVLPGVTAVVDESLACIMMMKVITRSPEATNNVGYHTKTIDKGDYGEISKIREEVEELIDAQEQGCKLMQLIELSDIYGAMEGYVNKHFSNITMSDIVQMANITSRAFASGKRT